jgi:hypothetical protein
MHAAISDLPVQLNCIKTISFLEFCHNVIHYDGIPKINCIKTIILFLEFRHNIIRLAGNLKSIRYKRALTSALVKYSLN